MYLECDPLLGRDQSAEMVIGARTSQSDTCPLISVLMIQQCVKISIKSIITREGEYPTTVYNIHHPFTPGDQ